MEAVSQELALHYLLELSPDIRVALLLDEAGRLSAAAPEAPSEGATQIGAELWRQATALTGSDPSNAFELDITVDGGSVFLVREDGATLISVTGPFVLPGLILHDMRIVLGDLRRAASPAGEQ